jgi:hypothetical protein
LLTRIALEGLKKALTPALDYFAEVVVNPSCTKIALEGLKKDASKSLDHSPEVVVNASCSQELLRKE